MSYGIAVKQQAEAPQRARTDFRCKAHGCPNTGGIGGLFGVDRSGVCYFHYQAEPAKWGETTAEILATDRMRDPVYKDPALIADKRHEGPRAWAHVLKAREEQGDRLTPAQKAMWRSAIGVSRGEA